MAKIKTVCRKNTNLPLEAPAASAQPDAAGLDRVLQVRMLERDLQLPALLPLEEIVRWQERKHRRTPWKQLRRRYGIWPTEGGTRLFDPARVSAKRYYYRGTRIPTPWPSTA